MFLPLIIPADAEVGCSSIALSVDWRAVVCDDGITLSTTDCRRRQTTLREAWDSAAEQVLTLVSRHSGPRMRLVPVTDKPDGATWYQLPAVGGTPAPWLAHPWTFTVLDSWVRWQLGPQPVYRLSEHTIIHDVWVRAAADTSPLNDHDVVFDHGFPASAGRTIRRPASSSGTPGHFPLAAVLT